MALAALVGLVVVADPFPPTLSNNGVHFPPVAWPSEPSDPAQCGANCGEWLPYTRFQNNMADPRVQDPSNGGTAPQNYVNISSSCTDKTLPSIYYALKQGAAADGSQDVIMFRWRVEQIANNYATGPSAGNYGATDPWSSALWSVLFDVDGDGYMDVAAHLDGSSGSPSAAIDRLAGVWGKLPTQSMDYVNDPSVKLIAHNPTAVVDGASGKILNYQGTLTPTPTWPSNGSSWDYGTTRAKRVSSSPCDEYFVDYQIPVRMLDASSTGPNPALNGPKITRSSPISMLFCTANSLNNPFQKDCAINASWLGGVGKPAPFGDYISFNQASAYAQPIVSSVTATAPNSCPGNYTLGAKVQDTLAVVNGQIVTSVKSVKFYYYRDANGDGVANDGGSWTFAADGTLKSGSLNDWSASWSGASLPKGKYLIGVQALDDNTLVDLGVTPSGKDNRTFSYITGDSANRIYVNGTDYVTPTALPNPPASPGAENWWGNPAVTGTQVALVGLALNTCGVAPTITKTVAQSNLAAGGTTTFTVTVGNTTGSAITLSQIDDPLPSGFSFQSTTSFTNGAAAVTGYTPPSANATGTVSWIPASALTVANNSSVVLSFVAKAGLTSGNYNNTASANTSFGTLTSSPVALQVDAARLSLSKTPSQYSINPDGATQLTYTIGYSNDSVVPVTNASISDPLPAGVTFVSCSGGCVNSSGTLSWSLGTLAGGSTGTVTATVTVNSSYASSSLSNTASISATAPDSSTVSKSATATIAVNITAPAFSLSKSASLSSVAPGANVTWTLAYRNYGSGSGSSVVLSDPLPSGFTYVSSSPAASSAPAVGANGTVSWNLGTVASGASGTVQVVAQAGNPFTGTSNPSTNTASLSWTGGTPVTATNQVGVTQTGATCTKYYLQGTTTNVGTLTGNLVGTSTALSGNQYIAQTATPSGATSTVSTAIAASGSPVETEIARFYQDPVSSQLISFDGSSTLSGQIYYTKANVANANLTLYARVYDYNPATGAQTLIGSTSYTDNGSPTPPISLSSVTPTGSLSKGHRLLVVVSALLANNKASTISVQVNSTSSYVQLCAPAPANLVLQKSVNASTVNLTGTGRTLTYTLNYANSSGSTDATSVVLSDPLPSGTTFVSASSSPAATSVSTPTVGTNGTVTWNFATVAKSTSGTATVVVNVPDDLSGVSAITNTASVSSNETAAVNASATTQVVGSAGSPSLSLSKAASKTALLAGDAVIYTLTVVNTGTAAASGVTVSDVLPVQSYFTYGSCATATGSCSQSAGTLTWNVGGLAAGASASVTVTMNAAATGVPAGVTLLNNTATAADSSYCTGGTPPASCTSNQVTVSLSGNPNLTLTKAAAPASVTPGDDVTYTLVVSNTGSSSAQAVVVRDPIPANLSFKAITNAGPGSASFDALNNQVVFNVGTLAAGGSATLAFKATVGKLASGNTTLTNNASTSADNAPGKTAQASNTATAAPNLSLSKTGPASLPFPAATLSAAVNANDTVFVNSSALLDVGAWVQLVNGTGNPVLQVVSISGNAVKLSAAVTAASGAALRKAGTWSMTYQNTGNADAASATVSDPLPGSWVYVAATPSPASAPAVGANGTVQWNLGTLAPNASGVLQVTAIPTATGSSSNVATLSASGLANVTASADLATGGLTVTKSTSTPITTAGGTASYAITVSNSLGSAVSGITVTDTLSSGFAYKAGTGKVGAVVTAPSFDAADTVFNQPMWTGITVPANGAVTITFDVDVAASVGPATYQNNVALSGLPVGVASVPFDPFSTTAEDVTVLASGTGVVQGYVYKDINNNGQFDSGTDLPLTSVGITVQDSGSVTYTASTDSAGFYQRVVPLGSTTVTVTTADIPAGLSLRAGQSNPGTVTVAAGTPARKDTAYVSPLPVLSVSKTHSGNFTAGSTGNSYTVTVSNTGSVATSGQVSLTDTAPTGLTITAMSGTGWTCTTLPTCTRSDALAGNASYEAITVTVSVAVNASSPLVNSVTASGGGSASATATDSTTIVQPAGWTVAGVVFNDADGSGLKAAGESGTNAGGLNAVLVNGSGNVVATSTVSGTGAWSFAGIADGSYTVRLSRQAGTVGNAAPAVSLPVGWFSTGESANGSSTDGTVDSTVSITVSGANLNAPTLGIRQQADVIVQKNGPAVVAASGALSYTVHVYNAGPGAADGTVVADAVPSGVTGMAWTCGGAVGGAACPNASGSGAINETVATLPAGGRLSYTVTGSAPASGSFTNTASATVPAAVLDPNTANNSGSVTTQIGTPGTVADLAVSKSGTASVLASGAVSYQVVVSNAGPAAANNALFTDPVAAGLTGASWTCGRAVGGAVCPNASGTGAISETLATFPAGASLVYTITATAPAAGAVTNTATIAAPGGVTDPVTDNNTASATTTVVGALTGSANLAVAKTGPTTVSPAGALSYKLVVSNAGPDAVSGARVTDALPSVLGSVTWSCGSASGGATCVAPTTGTGAALDAGVDLPAGASVVITVSATAPASSATFINLARITPPSGVSDPDPTNNLSAPVITTVLPAPDVYTTVNAPASVPVSGVVNAVVAFGNQGSVAAAGVTYQFTLPTGLGTVACTGASCSYNSATGVVTVSGLPTTLSAGAQASVTVSYTAPATAGTNVVLTSTIATTTSGETPTANNTAQATTQTTAAAGSADMTTTVSAPATAYAGSTVNVGVTYANLGGANASGTTFTLTGLPVGASIRYQGVACTWTNPPGTLSGCGLPSTVPMGQSISLQATYVAPASGTVTVTSTVGANNDGNAGNNTASAATVIGTAPATPQADVATTVAAPAKGVPATTVLANVTFSNAGPASAASVVYTLTVGGGATAAQVSYNGQACAYAGGTVSGCGLPSSLNAGQSLAVVLSFTAPKPASGSVTVPVSATIGTSTSETNTANNTAAASVLIPAETPSGTISGRVWYDTNRNRRFDANEVGRVGWPVDLLQGGNVLQQTRTDSSGRYTFTGLADGTYAVRFLARAGLGSLPVNGENGASVPGGGTPGYSILNNIVISGSTATIKSLLKAGAADTVDEQSLPIDPSGTVYDSTTRLPIAGATVTLGSGTCGAMQSGWVVGGSTSVTTGADGAYAFYFDPSAPTNCNFTLTVSKGGYTFQSTAIPPAGGTWPSNGGAVTAVNGAPSGGQATTYYLSGPVPTADLTNNNLPLDPVPVATSVPSIPTLSEWALMLLAGLMVLGAAAQRRSPARAAR